MFNVAFVGAVSGYRIVIGIGIYLDIIAGNGGALVALVIAAFVDVSFSSCVVRERK